VLERLGDPADIAAEARDRFGVPAQPASQIAAAIYLAIRLRAHAKAVPEPHERSERGAPWLEVATLVALLIPFLGWAVGLVLLWLSRTWTTREKAIATMLPLGIGALGLAALSSPIEWLRPLLVIALTVPTVIYLGIRLRAHADAMLATG
jgi:hypothetical protein